MKLSLALRPKRPLSRSEAWGCFTANLALPGSGSLVAGRAVGYLQLALTVIGFIVTLVGGVAFIRWYLANSTQFNNLQNDDPFGALASLWREVRWPLTGVAVFLFAMAWAAITSLQIMRSNPKESAPPRLGE